jgi:hypothetical protein
MMSRKFRPDFRRCRHCFGAIAYYDETEGVYLTDLLTRVNNESYDKADRRMPARTALATELTALLCAVVFNADADAPIFRAMRIVLSISSAKFQRGTPGE